MVRRSSGRHEFRDCLDQMLTTFRSPRSESLMASSDQVKPYMSYAPLSSTPLVLFLLLIHILWTTFTHRMLQDHTTSSSLGTRWFQEKAWIPTSKLERSHQQGSQEDRIGWDEVQEATEDRKSWWNHVTQEAGFTNHHRAANMEKASYVLSNRTER